MRVEKLQNPTKINTELFDAPQSNLTALLTNQINISKRKYLTTLLKFQILEDVFAYHLPTNSLNFKPQGIIVVST